MPWLAAAFAVSVGGYPSFNKFRMSGYPPTKRRPQPSLTFAAFTAMLGGNSL